MSAQQSGLLGSAFRFVVAKRWWIVAIYALLLPPSILFALRVRHDNSLDRLIVQSDPDAINTRAFEEVFGSTEYVLLLAEAPDPLSPGALARIDALERSLAAIPGVEPNSPLTIFRRARGSFSPTPEGAAAFRRFVADTTLFEEQALIGEGYLAIPVVLRREEDTPLQGLLDAIDGVVAPIQADPAPLAALRKIGGAYVDAYLDRETARSTARFMPFFALLLLGLNFALYRSFRALAAFVITIGVCVVLTVGYVGATGGVLTIVSPLVPMTILITCTATLVYLHSRFVDHPEESTVDEHQIFALVNKFTACSVSLFATAVGFGALAVSQIRPIRELGIWVAVGLLFTWIVVFTLFPALQKILRTPTHRERRTAGDWIHALADFLPRFSYRWRWPLVLASLALCAIGAVSIFGLPGFVLPMSLETSGIEYINHNSQLYEDTKRFQGVIAGLTVTEVWIKGEPAALTDPEVLRGLDQFQERLRSVADVGSVAGPTTILRMLSYLGGRGDRFPEDPDEAKKLATDLELLLPDTPALRGFIDPSLSQTHIAVISRAEGYERIELLSRRIRETWAMTAMRIPSLSRLEILCVGAGPLQAKISYHLVPTLTESFAITAIVIFLAFLVVFRSGPARLMAMIPSLFAILVMFAVMRVTGMALNVATILIASTVLGTSENDQIHFFYHYQEKRRRETAEAGLRHTLRIAGRAIVFATIINAGGFLAFAFADLPPMREFGVLTALAFLLSMLADFTALPAALWILSGERPNPRQG